MSIAMDESLFFCRNVPEKHTEAIADASRKGPPLRLLRFGYSG
jgi:hypothetical protein